MIIVCVFVVIYQASVLVVVWPYCSHSTTLPPCQNDGERFDPGNYRPKHLDGTGLFSDLHYGFRAFRSTADLPSECIYNSLDVAGERRVIALDISKDCYTSWMHTVLGALFFPSLNLFFKICPLRLLITSLQEYLRDWFWDPHCFLVYINGWYH